MKIGRAVIEKEPDDQYTLLIYSKVDDNDESLDSATANMTLPNAFNTARDSLAAMATGNEKHRRIVIVDRIS